MGHGSNFDFQARVMINEGMISISTWVHQLNGNKRSYEDIISEALRYVGLDWYKDIFDLTAEQLENDIELLFKGHYSGWMSYCYSAGSDEWDEEIDVEDGWELACSKIEEPVNNGGECDG